MKLIRTLFGALVVLATISVGVLFALQNDMAVPLDMLIYSFGPKSLALWLLGALAIGGLLGMLVSSGIIVRLHAGRSSANRQLEKARLELDKLRTAGLNSSE